MDKDQLMEIAWKEFVKEHPPYFNFRESSKYHLEAAKVFLEEAGALLGDEGEAAQEKTPLLWDASQLKETQWMGDENLACVTWDHIPDHWYFVRTSGNWKDAIQKLHNMPEPKIVDGKVVLQGEEKPVSVELSKPARVMTLEQVAEVAYEIYRDLVPDTSHLKEGLATWEDLDPEFRQGWLDDAKKIVQGRPYGGVSTFAVPVRALVPFMEEPKPAPPQPASHAELMAEIDELAESTRSEILGYIDGKHARARIEKIRSLAARLESPAPEAPAPPPASVEEVLKKIDVVMRRYRKGRSIVGMLLEIRAIVSRFRSEPALQPITDEAIAEAYCIANGHGKNSKVEFFDYLSTLGTPAPEPAPAPLVVGITVEDLAKLWVKANGDAFEMSVPSSMKSWIEGDQSGKGWTKVFHAFMEVAAPHIKPRPAPQSQADAGMVRLHSVVSDVEILIPCKLITNSYDDYAAGRRVEVRGHTFIVSNPLDEITAKIAAAKAQIAGSEAAE